MKLPGTLVRNLHDIHAHADPWLADLDVLIWRCEERWHLRAAGLVPDLSYNVVAFAEGLDGAAYILKLSPPNSEFSQEIAALRLYDGDGICRLIDADDAAGVMLLERLEPGVSFWYTNINDAHEDDLATRAAATLMPQLWRPVSDLRPFRSLQSWSRALPKYLKDHPSGGPLPPSFLGKANGLLGDFLSTSAEPVLLHADLHHGNVVSATRQPHLVIDPKGIVGPRGYDVGSWLGNPKPSMRVTAPSELREVLARRVAIFSEMLDLDAQEVAAWGLVHMALEACWHLADHGEGWEAAIKVGDELNTLV